MSSTKEKIGDLESEEGSSREVRSKAKEELDKLGKEAESVLKVLEELDINPDAWDDKLRRVKNQLMSMMGESQSRRAVFQWWENMASVHVKHMGKKVSQGLQAGGFGVKVAAGGKGLSSIDAGVCVGKAGVRTEMGEARDLIGESRKVSPETLAAPYSILARSLGADATKRRWACCGPASGQLPCN